MGGQECLGHLVFFTASRNRLLKNFWNTTPLMVKKWPSSPVTTGFQPLTNPPHQLPSTPLIRPPRAQFVPSTDNARHTKHLLSLPPRRRGGAPYLQPTRRIRPLPGHEGHQRAASSLLLLTP